jgi:hypothetical protein
VTAKAQTAILFMRSFNSRVLKIPVIHMCLEILNFNFEKE